MKIKELRENKANLWEQAKEVLDTAEKEGRVLSDEENVRFEKINDEITAIDEHIEKAEKVREMTANQVEKAEEIVEKSTKVDDKKAYDSALRDYLANGDKRMSEESREILVRAQSVGTDAKGGYTVPDLMSSEIIESMAAFGGVRQNATVITTTKGEQIDYPTVDDTSNKGAILAENGAINAQDLAFGTKPLNAWKYESKLILTSRELLTDSHFNLDAFIREQLTTRLGRATEEHYTTGDGSSKPNGVVTAATFGAVTASTTAVTFDEIYDLMDSTDPAYDANARFMMNKSTLTAIRKLKDGDSQYLWNPGDPVSGAAATIAGKPYTMNQDMASIGASNKFMLYGDFSKYYIRDVAGIELFRLDELYAANYQVGFVGFLRTDGELMDTAAVKYIYTVAT